VRTEASRGSAAAASDHAQVLAAAGAGVTHAISASGVNVPGRPADPAGVNTLALAAQRYFAHTPAPKRPAMLRLA
jgi:hypothetical protein